MKINTILDLKTPQKTKIDDYFLETHKSSATLLSPKITQINKNKPSRHNNELYNWDNTKEIKMYKC